MPISSRDNEFTTFIDQIVFGKRAWEWVDLSSFKHMTYREADKEQWDKISDPLSGDGGGLGAVGKAQRRASASISSARCSSGTNKTQCPNQKGTNDIVRRWQGNRNPFIDHAEFAQAIWDPECG